MQEQFLKALSSDTEYHRQIAEKRGELSTRIPEGQEADSGVLRKLAVSDTVTLLDEIRFYSLLSATPEYTSWYQESGKKTINGITSDLSPRDIDAAAEWLCLVDSLNDELEGIQEADELDRCSRLLDVIETLRVEFEEADCFASDEEVEAFGITSAVISEVYTVSFQVFPSSVAVNSEVSHQIEATLADAA